MKLVTVSNGLDTCSEVQHKVHLTGILLSWYVSLYVLLGMSFFTLLDIANDTRWIWKHIFLDLNL